MGEEGKQRDSEKNREDDRDHSKDRGGDGTRAKERVCKRRVVWKAHREGSGETSGAEPG